MLSRPRIRWSRSTHRSTSLLRPEGLSSVEAARRLSVDDRNALRVRGGRFAGRAVRPLTQPQRCVWLAAALSAFAGTLA
jgi:hypothetical protein